MTNSPTAAPAGSKEPRVSSVPPSVSSTGAEAVELCEMAGLFLDPWEQLVLTAALGEREDGKWAAFEVGLMVSRQNGKGAILEARELAGLFLLNERLLIHSAHQFDTSLEAFRRLRALVEDTPDFSKRVKRISNSHGEEGIELHGGQRIRFRTRTKGGGRGFSSDCLILDEAMDIPEMTHGALLPTLSARENPQVWYTGSAVDQWVHDNGLVFARIRERGHRGDDPSLAYFEWSAEGGNPEEVADPGDPDAWAQANPALGIRISAEHIERERRSMDDRTFAVERLGVGDWPRTDGFGDQLIGPEVWNPLADERSRVVDPVAFCFDVAPDRSSASIAVAGRRADGLGHVEVIDRRRGTGWVAERMAELIGKHDAEDVVCDGSGPAASLLGQMKEAGVEVTTVTAKEHGQACGTFYDACAQKALRHLDQPELNAAIKGAAQRPLGDAWAWSRKSSSVDISPLVSCTLAFWRAMLGSDLEQAAPMVFI